MDTGSESIDLFDSSAAEFSDAEESDVSGVDVSKTYPMALSTQKMRPFMSEKGKRYKSYESKNESPAASEIGPTPTGQPKLKKNPRYTPTGQLKLKKNPRSLQYSLSSGESSAAVLSALGDLTNTLTKVVKRLEKTESRILSMEEKIGSNMSSSSSTEHQPYHKPRRVPVVVRSETRKMYQTLMDGADDFVGFSVGQTISFKDTTNQAVTARLVKEVKALNSKFIAADIRNAAYTYYKTLCQEDSLQRRGLFEQRKKQRRRKERISRKLQERQAAFKKLSFAEKDQEKWKKVFCVNFMSSEESDSTIGDEIQVRPLSWRSYRVTSFFHSLDKKSQEEKSPRAKRQMKARRMGNSSTRMKPTHDSEGQILPSWLFAMCNNA